MAPAPTRAGGFVAQQRLAAGLAGATEDIKWEADLVYSVGERMFCVFLLRAGVPSTCSFKVDSERFLELTGVPGVKPAPYLARSHWVQVQETGALPGAELNKLIRRSHALVGAKLTKKRQQELGLAP